MNKAPLFAVAAAALLFAGASPALAGDRDHTSFSFGVVVGDGGYYHRGHAHRYARDYDDCDRSYYQRTYYSRPYYYQPRERVVVIDRDRDRDRRHWHRHYHHDRHWD